MTRIKDRNTTATATIFSSKVTTTSAALTVTVSPVRHLGTEQQYFQSACSTHLAIFNARNVNTIASSLAGEA